MSTTPPTIPGDIAASSTPQHGLFWLELINQLEQNLPSILAAIGGTVDTIVAPVFATVVEVAIEATSYFGKRLGEAVDEFEAEAAPQLMQMAAIALSDYFNTSISAAQIGPGRGEDQRFRFSEQLGRLVLENMFGAFSSPRGLDPEMGVENAERILGFNISTAIESWLGSVLSKAPIVSWFPNWADLDDIMSANLGLSRTSRRVMGPLLKTLVVDPFTWDLNRRYTPARLSVSELVRFLNRNPAEFELFFEQMSWHGYDQATASRVHKLSERLPEKEDVSKMLELELIDEDQAGAFLRASGFTAGVADAMVTLAVEDRFRSIRTAMESVARDMFRDREIDEPELRAILRDAGRGPKEIDALLALAQLERSRPKPLPRGEYEAAFRKGLIPLSKLRAYYQRDGYSLDDIVLLEEMAMEDRVRALELEEAAKRKAETTEFRAVPRGQLERAYIEGRVDAGRLRAYYEDRQYAPDDVAVLLELATARKTEFDRKEAEALAIATTPAFRELPQARIEEAFLRDVVELGRVAEWYRLAKFRPEDIPIALETLRQRKAERKERLEEELRRANRPDFSELPRSVMEEAFLRGVVDEARLTAWYEAQPFRAEEIPVLLALARERLAERRAKAEGASPKAKT